MSDRLKAMKARVAPREVETSIGPVLVRPLRLENLVLAGTIPLALLNKIGDLAKPSPGRSPEKVLADTMEALPGFKAVVFAAAVDPRITEEPTDDSMGWQEFSQEDLGRIFSEAIRPAVELATFPGTEEPGSGGVDAPDGEGVREAAE